VLGYIDRWAERHWPILETSATVPTRLTPANGTVSRPCESQLRAIMDAYHPGPLHVFSSLDRNISLYFIADYPTPKQAGLVGAARMDASGRSATRSSVPAYYVLPPAWLQRSYPTRRAHRAAAAQPASVLYLAVRNLDEFRSSSVGTRARGGSKRCKRSPSTSRDESPPHDRHRHLHTPADTL
jgi:hypothetical protein